MTARGGVGGQQPYSEIPGVNWSSLRYMSVSPRMYRHRLTHPEPRKPAWVMGGAIHCVVLEPDMFESRYVVLAAETIKELAPGRNTKEGKALIAEHPEWATGEMTSDEYQAACIAAACDGKEALTLKQYQTCIAARDAVREHRVARDLLRGGCAEETITWTDGDTGIKCKARLDYLRPDLVIDLKSSRDPAPSKFEKDAANYGIVAQVSMYHDGAQAAKRITGGQLPCVIAVRVGDDYDVAPYQITREAYSTGSTIYRSLLHRLEECIAADYWPGVAPEMRDLNLPPWAITEIIDTPNSEGF